MGADPPPGSSKVALKRPWHNGCVAAAHYAIAGVVCASGSARPCRAPCALDVQCTAAALPRQGAWCAMGRAEGQRRSWCLALLHVHPWRLTLARCGGAQAYAALQAVAAGILGGAANGAPGGAAAGGSAAAAAPGASAGAGAGASGSPAEQGAHHMAALHGILDIAVRTAAASTVDSDAAAQQLGLSESGESLPWPQSDLSDMEADAEGEALLEAEAGGEAGDGSEGEGPADDEAGDVLDMEADLDGLDGHMGTNLTEGRNACGPALAALPGSTPRVTCGGAEHPCMCKTLLAGRTRLAAPRLAGGR